MNTYQNNDWSCRECGATYRFRDSLYIHEKRHMTNTFNPTPTGATTNAGIPAVPVVDEPAEVVKDNTRAINQANFVLGWLVGEAMKYGDTLPGVTWAERLSPLLNDKEFESARKAIRQKLPTAEGVEIPVKGIVPAGTTIANEALPLAQKGEAAAAINLLKSTDRILQCGRGRGKALVILSNDPLPLDTQVPDETTKAAVSSESDEDIEVIMANDIPNLLRAARDEYRNLKRRAEEAERNLSTAKNRVQELEVQIEGKDAEIEGLQRRLQQQALTTWQ